MLARQYMSETESSAQMPVSGNLDKVILQAVIQDLWVSEEIRSVYSPGMLKITSKLPPLTMGIFKEIKVNNEISESQEISKDI